MTNHEARTAFVPPFNCVEDRPCTADEAAEHGYRPSDRVRYVAYVDGVGDLHEYIRVSGRGRELLPDA